MFNREKRKKKKELRKLKIDAIKKLLIKGNNMWVLFFLGLGVLTFSLMIVVVKAEREGVSQAELDQKNKLMEMEYESISSGHIGGDEKLIKEDYEEEISREAFKEEKEENDSFFVYFYSPYCPYCADVGDTIIDVLDDSEVDYVVVDVNEDKEFQDTENAGEVPRMVKYEDGGVEDEIIGLKEKEEYKDFVDKNRDGKDEDN